MVETGKADASVPVQGQGEASDPAGPRLPGGPLSLGVEGGSAFLFSVADEIDSHSERLLTEPSRSAANPT